MAAPCNNQRPPHVPHLQTATEKTIGMGFKYSNGDGFATCTLM
jgi:hypothetical protein